MSTLLFCDAFYHYLVSEMGTMWDSGTGAFVSGRYASSNGFKGTATKTFFNLSQVAAPQSEVTVGFNWTIGQAQIVNLPISITGSGISFQIINNGNNTFSAQLTVSSTVYSDSTKTTFAAVYGTWNFYEYQVSINLTTVTYTFKVDGATLLSGTYTVTTSDTFTSISCNSLGGVIADLYVTDSAFLGPNRILCINPIANGSEHQFTPLANANWQEVQEIPPDDDTSYNYTKSSAEDLYELNPINITPAPTVLGIQVCARIKNVDADIVNGQIPFKTSSEVDLPSTPLTISNPNYSYILSPQLINPITSDPWAISDINELQVGLKVGINTGTVTVPAGSVYQLQLGVNLPGFAPQSAVPEARAGTFGIPTSGQIGSWTITVSGPKTGGGTQVKTIVITTVGNDGSNHLYYPPPWIQQYGQTVIDGYTQNTVNDPQVPFVATKTDGFAFNEGDTITISSVGSFLCYPIAFDINIEYAELETGYINPLYGLNNPDGWYQWLYSSYWYTSLEYQADDMTPFGFKGCYKPNGAIGAPGGFSGTPPNVTFATPSGARWSTLTTGYPSCQCDQTTGPIGIGGLIGAFAGTNQITNSESQLVQGSGIVVGTPFMIGLGGNYLVGNP